MMLLPRRLVLFAAVAAGLGVATVASAKLTRTKDPAEVRFVAKASGGLTIKGETTQLTVVDDGQLVKIFVPLNTLDTGIDLRNRHMKDYLQTKDAPNAELQVPRAQLKFPSAQAPTSGEATGTLTIHGVSRPTVFKYTARLDGAALDVTGSTRIKMTDFGIAQPKYMGVEVKPEVDITVHFRATDG